MLISCSYQRLNACEDGGHVVCWTPAVLKNIKADPTVSVDVGVEHLGEELDNGGLVRVLLTELQSQFERSILDRHNG